MFYIFILLCIPNENYDSISGAMTKTESSSESSPVKEPVAVTVTEPEDGKTEDGNDAEVNELAASMKQELTIKHPLQHAWTLWYYRNDRTKSWEENLREVVTFDTVEVCS